MKAKKKATYKVGGKVVPQKKPTDPPKKNPKFTPLPKKKPEGDGTKTKPKGDGTPQKGIYTPLPSPQLSTSKTYANFLGRKK